MRKLIYTEENAPTYNNIYILDKSVFIRINGKNRVLIHFEKIHEGILNLYLVGKVLLTSFGRSKILDLVFSKFVNSSKVK